MAACARIGCGGGGGNCSLRYGQSDRWMVKTRPPNVFSIPGRRSPCGCAALRISMSMAEMAPIPVAKPERRRIYGGEKGETGEAVVSRERLDEWMRDSVVEIVKNLRESPLLVHVYEGSNGTVRTTTEKAEDWPVVKQRWGKGEAQVPEGVIFLEQLEDDEQSDQDPWDEHGGDDASDARSEGTRVWGIVAQGRGVNCGPVCYLLKTTRVLSGVGSGSGVCCTHFCLIRVKSFRETAKSQLQNYWLVQAAQ